MKIMRTVVLASTLTWTQLFAATSIENLMVQVDQIVDGHVVRDYVNIWWQWANSMPPEYSPVRDYTGEHCHEGQKGDVWFLAGGYGTSTINRKCKIPAGKHLFFPVINTVYYPSHQGSLSCDQAKAAAAVNNDNLLDIVIELDGIPSWNPASTRMASQECFDLLGMVPPEFGPPEIYPAATDGYWVMLKPLSKGKHILSFQAMYGKDDATHGEVAQDIVYELTVR